MSKIQSKNSEQLNFITKIYNCLAYMIIYPYSFYKRLRAWILFAQCSLNECIMIIRSAGLDSTMALAFN